MHEMAICEALAGAIEREAQSRGLSRVSRAQLRVGKMLAFELEQLEICLKGMPQQSLLSGTTFELEEASVRIRCRNCSAERIDTRFDDMAFAHRIAHAPEFYRPEACPSCGSLEADIIDGRDYRVLDLA